MVWIWYEREESSQGWFQDSGMRNESENRSVVSNSLWPHGQYSPWSSPGQNTGVYSLSLLQGIFPTQGLNPGLPHWWWILYQLSHQGSPRILECVAYPFSSRSSQPRNWTAVSRLVGRFFTSWATKEALERMKLPFAVSRKKKLLYICAGFLGKKKEPRLGGVNLTYPLYILWCMLWGPCLWNSVERSRLEIWIGESWQVGSM